MRNTFPRFDEENLREYFPTLEGASLRVAIPNRIDEQSLSQWLRHIRDVLETAYRVQDGHAHAFAVGEDTVRRSLAGLEFRVRQLERNLRYRLSQLKMMVGAGSAGSHVLLDLLTSIAGASGVSYSDDRRGYTLSSGLVVQSLLSPVGEPLVQGRLVRSLGRVLEAGDATALLVSHSEEVESWTTELPVAPSASPIASWLPYTYQSGELLQFQWSGVDTFFADELIVRSVSPVRVVQYRLHPIGRRRELCPSPRYSDSVWGRSGGSVRTEDRRQYAVLPGGTMASVWFTAGLDELPSGCSSRGFELLLRLRSVGGIGRVYVEAYWIRGGRVIGQESAWVEVSVIGSEEVYVVWLEEPDGVGGAEQVRVVVRQSGTGGNQEIHVFGANLVLRDLHFSLASTADTVQIVPISNQVQPFTRFDVVLENPIGEVAPGTVRYRTALRNLSLLRSARTRRGRIRFVPMTSADAMRHLRFWVSGENLHRSELVVRNAVNNYQQVIPLQSATTQVDLWFVPEGSGATFPSGQVVKCPLRTTTDRFISTVEREVTLSHTPWVDQQAVTEEVASTGGYDPNGDRIDLSTVENLIRSGVGTTGSVYQSGPSEWSTANRTVQGGYVVYRPVVSAGSSASVSVAWSSGGWALPGGDGVLVLPVRSWRVRWKQALVRVNGGPSRFVVVDRVGFSGRDGEHDGYLLVELTGVREVRQLSVTLPPKAWVVGDADTELMIQFGMALGYLRASGRHVPVRVEAVLHGLYMPPGGVSVSGTREHYVVRRERLQTATEERVGQYSSWVGESQDGSRQYIFSGERQIHMLQYYPIAVREGRPQIQLYVVEPVLETRDGKSILVDKSTPLPDGQYRLVPEFGLVEVLTELPKDGALLADYVFDGRDADLVSRWRRGQGIVPQTLNRTDYVNRQAVQLRLPNINPADPEYYPVLEYVHRGRKLEFPVDVVSLEHGDALRVTYSFLALELETELVLRDTPEGPPVLRSAVADITVDGGGW